MFLEKEKMLLPIIFTFSRNVFNSKASLFKGRYKLELFGKEFTESQV